MLVGVRDRPHLELEILQSSQRTKTKTVLWILQYNPFLNKELLNPYYVEAP